MDENSYIYIGRGKVAQNGIVGELKSTKEYAKLMGVQENTIRVWVRRGKVVPVKIGRDNYYFVPDKEESNG